jgi:hypothetical protein
MKIDRGPRMVFRWDGRLLLLSVGAHQVTEQYTSAQLKQDLKALSPARGPLGETAESGGRIFSNAPDTKIHLLDESEPSAAWTYYLDAEQTVITGLLLDAAEGLRARREPSVHFLIGGPGTGKTCILLNMLDLLRDERGVEVRIHLSDRVAQFANSAVSYSLEEFFPKTPGGGTPRVLLVDDPRSLEFIRDTSEVAILARHQMVVFAFDPLQLAEAVSDKEFERIVQKYRAAIHKLAMCYRQKANVGTATKKAVDAIAASTPFLDESKIRRFNSDHAGLTRLSNELRFCNPHGYVQTYVAAAMADLEQEMARLQEHPELLWKHWPYLLVAVDDVLYETFRRAMQEGQQAGVKTETDRKVAKAELVRLSDIETLKGVEYQHVFLLLSEPLYREIELGFRGSGQRTYRSRRLLRIPFSRARDSLVTFVFPSTENFVRSAGA